MHDLLQSQGWEAFQRSLGRRVWRVDGVLAIAIPLPFGHCFLSSPRYVVPARRPEESSTKDLAHAVRAIAKETGAIFWRAEFPSDLTPNASHLTPPRILRRLIEPEWTWRVACDRDDGALLVAMHPKHRYNIGLAERHSVTVRIASLPLLPSLTEGVGDGGGGVRTSGGDLDAFWSLLQETARRQGIATHPKQYYVSMFDALRRASDVKRPAHDADCRLYFAEHEGAPIATALVAYHGDTATYLHGGSSHAHRALMAPHLLHWTAIRDARTVGCRWYDFGGVEPHADPSHSTGRGSCKPQAGQAQSIQHPESGADWSGITRFKAGFGGEAVHHPPPMDLVFRRGWYTLLAALARMRG